MAFFISLHFIIASCSDRPSTAEKTSSTAGPPSNNKETSTEVQKRILFFGNSLTAAYGLDPSEGFPALIQQKIDSLGLPYVAVNAGLSGETSAGGKERITWLLEEPVSIFVLELGANDGLRGLPLTATRQNLQAIIDQVKKAYPKAQLVIAGMQLPPNMGEEYTSDFRELYKTLTEENNAILIPFLLEGVGGIPTLNQADGIHPTAAGQQIIANNVWTVLRPLLLQE